MPTDFAAAFAQLREILRRHAAGMDVVADSPTDFTVSSRATLASGKPLWFGCVMMRKTAVTFHLFPLYFNPALQAAVPPTLRPRKQGKTCFNFKRPDSALFAQLDDLTRQARAAFERHGLLDPGPVPPDRFNAALRAGGEDPDALARLRKTRARQAARKRAATLRARI